MDAERLTFTVIIVNFNGGELVQKALDSLRVQTRQDFEVILVDNASSDHSIDALDTTGLPRFTLMAEAENHGFARANNLAARRAKGDWLVLLNPDAQAKPDWLDAIARAAQRHPDTRMFASLQLDATLPSTLDGAGDAYLVFGFPWRGGFGRPVREIPGEGECFSPCGAGAVFERDLFLRHGGFDESFFCFCEDVDLGFRLRLAGERCLFIPDAVIHHVGGALSGRESEFATFHGTRNRLWTYVKNMPAPLLWLTLPGHVTLMAYLLVRAVMTGRAGPMWRGVTAGLKGLREIRAARSAAPPRRGSLWEVARAMSWNPLRMSQRMVHIRLPRTQNPSTGLDQTHTLRKPAQR